VERWFGKITTERIRRGVFTSVPQLERAIYDYIEHNNAWTKPLSRQYLVPSSRPCPDRGHP
jgi:hypothetical protein